MTPLRHRWSLAQLRRAEIIGVVAVVALGGATAAWRLTSGDAANPDWVVTTGVTTATPTTIGVVSHPPVPHTPSGTDAVEVESEAPVPASAGNGEAVDPSGTDAPTSSVSGASVPITRAPRGTTPSTTVAGEVSDVPFDLPTSDADSSSTSSTPTTEPDARTGTPPVPATTVAGTTPVTATPRTTTTTTPPTTAAPTTTRPPATTTTTTVPTTTTTVPTTTTTTTTTTEPTTTTDSSTTTTDSSTTTTDPSPNS